MLKKTREGEYVDHEGQRIQFTDGKIVQLATELYQFLDQEYKGSKSVDAARVEGIIQDLQQNKPLDLDGWNVLNDLRHRFGTQFNKWLAAGKDGQETKIPTGTGRIIESVDMLPPSLRECLREVKAPVGQTGVLSADPNHPAVHQPTIAIDFDGVIHQGGHGMPGEVEGTVVKGAPQALKQLSQRYRVVVLTARQDFGAVRDWLQKNGMGDYVDEVTNVKPGALAYIDDRAIHFDGNWKDALDASDPDKSTSQPIQVKKTYEAGNPLEAVRLLVEQEYATPSTTKTDRSGTAAHLHDSVLHDLAHTRRHIERILDPDVLASIQSIKFNAEHALNHAESGQEHAHKLDDHLAKNPSDPKVWSSERKALSDMRSPNFLNESGRNLVDLVISSESYMTPDVVTQLREASPSPPPNLREAPPHDETIVLHQDTPVHECCACKMFNVQRQQCWGFGNVHVDPDWTCDRWTVAPDWKGQIRLKRQLAGEDVDTGRKVAMA